MNEAVPVVLGMLVGGAFARARSRWAVAAAAALAAGGGVLASMITGELAESWGYVLFDVALVTAAAAASALVLRRLGRRRAARTVT